MVLPARAITTYDPAELSRGRLQYEGWTIRPVDPFRLDVMQAGRPERTFRITLDEVKDRRWMSYSFIPPGPEHNGATVAVGCESGVWFYRLADGRPTRLYAGHSGPVYCLAPSKDGKWLATGSSDQTVRLWTLAGCDAMPTLGATFERRADGTPIVKSVEALSFAEAMGMKPGDVPVQFGLAGRQVTADDFLARFDAQLPNTPIELIVQRRVEAPPAPAPDAPAAARMERVDLHSTKRNSPAVSLFVGQDREWVLWTPSGFYDTSIAGDTKFLGWHLNQSTIFQPRPTDYLEIIKFEKQLRQPRRLLPNKLDTLLTTADLLLTRDLPTSPLLGGNFQVRPPDLGGIGAGRLDVRPDAPQQNAGQPGRQPLADLGAQPSGAPGIRAPAPAPEARPAGAGNAAGETVANVAPAPDTTPVPVPPGPAPAPMPAPGQPAGGGDAGAGRLVTRPDAPAELPVKPPTGQPLVPVLAGPPQPQPSAAPGVRPRTAAPDAGDLPLPAPAPAPALPVRTAAANQGPPAPGNAAPGQERIVPGGASPRADLALNTRPPLPGLPPANVPPPQPGGPQPGPGPDAPARRPVQPLPPPVEPAEFVERAQPPSVEPLIQPNQQITTLDGKPVDPRVPPPDKIAIGGDLGPDGRATVAFDLTIDASGRSPARSIDYLVDGHKVQPTTVFDRPIAVRREAVKLSLAPGPHRFTAEVENDLGVRRTITRDILVKGLPQPRSARLKILTIAPAFKETWIPPILFADRDAKELQGFLRQYLVSPENEKPIYSIDEEFLEGTAATTERVKKAVDALKDESFGEGDLLVVVIETHFLNVGSERRLVTADSLKIPPSPSVAADELGRNLGALAGRGCKVLVLLDGVHRLSKEWGDTDISEWVRNLRDEQNVITFVASNSGPSQVVGDQRHRAFAQAILDSIRPPALKEGVYSLNDFRDVVIDRVLKLTQRQQQAGCYLPESISGQFPLINPQSPPR
jgi:hypothetical protein